MTTIHKTYKMIITHKGVREMIEFLDIDFYQISLIKDLWEKNRLYHEERSAYFSGDYQSICFDDRMKKIKGFDKESFKITVCKDTSSIIGYCISTIIDGKGEVESIHVDKAYRGKGIGEKLVESHLDWMELSDCVDIGVTVSQENESAINFYKKLGFYPNTIHMEQLRKSKKSSEHNN